VPETAGPPAVEPVRFIEPVWFRSAWIQFAVILAALATAFFPALHGYYLHTDDYFFYRASGFTAREIFLFGAAHGIPAVWLVYWMFSAVGFIKTVAGLNLVRILSTCIISTLGVILYRYLYRLLSNWLVALAITIGLLTTPPFITYAAYFTMTPYGMGAICATLAWLIASTKVTVDGGKRVVFLPLAVLLMIISLCFYQVGSLFYVSLAAVATLLADPLTFRKHFRNLFTHAGIVAVAYAIYYVSWRAWIQSRDFPSSGKYDPRNFVTDIPGRIKWFISYPLVETSNLWLIHPNEIITLGVLAVITLAICVEYRSAPRDGQSDYRSGVVAKGLTLVLMIPATYGISLVSSAPSPEYRTYVALESAIGLLFLISLYRVCLGWRLMAPKAISFVMAAFAVFGIVSANDTVRRYFAIPDYTEFQFVKNEIATYIHFFGGGFQHVHVLTVNRPIAPDQRNEIGEPSLQHGENIRPIVMAAFDELGIHRDVPVSHSTPQTPAKWIEWNTYLEGMVLNGQYISPTSDHVLFIDATRIPRPSE